MHLLWNIGSLDWAHGDIEVSERANRLPAITAALVLEAVGLEIFRDRFGQRQCLANGVGVRRKKLSSIGEDPRTFAASDAELARDQARQLLAGICRVCPFEHCRMKSMP
jgi:hypothetical protein